MSQELKCEYDPPVPVAGKRLRNTVRIGPLVDTAVQKGYPYINVGVGLPYVAPEDWVWSEDHEDNPGASTNIHRALVDPLKRFVASLSYFSGAVGDSGYGSIDWIGHIGTGPGDDDPSYHWAFAAIDISHVHWAGGNISEPHEASGEVHSEDGSWVPTTHRRMLAVEACLRKWFGYVLNRNIRGHHNHFHVDLGTVPGQFSEELEEHVCSPSLRVFRSDLSSSISDPTSPDYS